MNNRIRNREDFTDKSYSLLPFNFERLNNDDVLIVNMVGNIPLLNITNYKI